MLFGTPVEGLDLGATYPTKDAPTDSEGMEYIAQVFDDTTQQLVMETKKALLHI